MRNLLIGVALGFLLAVGWSAKAQLSLSVFGLSKHSQPGYCEVNPGLGLNYQITNDLRAGVARLRISQCRPSNWIGLFYDPIKWGNFSFGIAFLRVTGYQDEPVYVPLPVGSYRLGDRSVIDFFIAHKDETSVTGAAWRYLF